MDKLNKRRSDRCEEDWDKIVSREGLERRLWFAAPGDELKLREGTEGAYYDEVRQITWAKVMELLLDKGVFEKKEEGVYVKLEEGLGDFGYDPSHLRRRIINLVEDELFAGHNFEDLESRRDFIRVVLERSMRESALVHDAHDYSADVDEFVARISDDEFDSPKAFEKIYRMFLSYFETIVSIQHKENSNYFLLVSYKGETKEIGSYHRMVQAWAADVLRNLRRLKERA